LLALGEAHYLKKSEAAQRVKETEERKKIAELKLAQLNEANKKVYERRERYKYELRLKEKSDKAFFERFVVEPIGLLFMLLLVLGPISVITHPLFRRGNQDENRD
jgi:Fe2+ transport system protein B